MLTDTDSLAPALATRGCGAEIGMRTPRNAGAHTAASAAGNGLAVAQTGGQALASAPFPHPVALLLPRLNRLRTRIPMVPGGWTTTAGPASQRSCLRIAILITRRLENLAANQPYGIRTLSRFGSVIGESLSHSAYIPVQADVGNNATSFPRRPRFPRRHRTVRAFWRPNSGATLEYDQEHSGAYSADPLHCGVIGERVRRGLRLHNSRIRHSGSGDASSHSVAARGPCSSRPHDRTRHGALCSSPGLATGSATCWSRTSLQDHVLLHRSHLLHHGVLHLSPTRVCCTGPLPLAGYLLFIGALLAWIAPRSGILAPAVIVYGLLLVTMAVLASGLNWLAAVGSMIFVVSDLSIAVTAFAFRDASKSRNC